jgi:hypothetical protein
MGTESFTHQKPVPVATGLRVLPPNMFELRFNFLSSSLRHLPLNSPPPSLCATTSAGSTGGLLHTREDGMGEGEKGEGGDVQ